MAQALYNSYILPLHSIPLSDILEYAKWVSESVMQLKGFLVRLLLKLRQTANNTRLNIANKTTRPLTNAGSAICNILFLQMFNGIIEY